MIDPLIRTDYKRVERDEPISRVSGFLRGDATALPIVTDGGKVLGILDMADLMRSALAENARISKHVQEVPAATRASTIEEAARILLASGAENAPVAERGRPIGFLSALDVAIALDARGASARDAIAELPALREGQTIGEALRAFRESRAPKLPVIGSDGRVTGFLARSLVLGMEISTARSHQRHASRDRESHLAARIDGHLETFWPSIGDGASLRETAELAKEWGVAPIANDRGETIGCATPRSLLRAAARASGTIPRDLTG